MTKLDSDLVKWAAIRPGVETDHAFVFNSFLRSFRASPVTRFAPDAAFFSAAHDAMQALLERHTLLVAADPGVPDEILGYLLYSPACVDYVYIKQKFRDNGLAKKLFNHASTNPAVVTFPFWTLPGVKLAEHLERSFPEMKFIFRP